MPFLELSHLEKTFGSNRVVKDFSLGIDKGEFVSFLGPSGCGKTTVLRMVAGFEQPDSGSIIIDGQDVTGIRASQRHIGMVFQAYALFPNLTVAGNVGFGLRIKGVARAEADERVATMLKLIGLPELGSRYPYQLSGGQQQRVALARALAPKPRVLLLDEPLSALDAKIRVNLRNEIRSIQRDLGITTIFVTHDQEEALSISDRIVVMNGGIADQVGTAFDIYNRPATRFVAGFVGTLNVLDAVVERPKEGLLSFAGNEFKVAAAPLAAAKGTTIAFGLRPEAVHAGRGGKADVTIEATVEDVHFMGSVVRLRARSGTAAMAMDMFNSPTSPPPAAGSKIPVSFNPADIILLQN